MNQSTTSGVVAITISMSLLVISHTIFITTVKGDPDTNVLDTQCDKEKWGPDDPYGPLVTELIRDLAAQGASSTKLDYEYYLDYSLGNVTAYGLSLCSGNLSGQDCATCLARARENLTSRCVNSIRAETTLVDCCMKYDDYPFYV